MIEVRGVKEAVDRIEKISRFENLNMGVVAAKMHKDVMEHFKAEQGPEGSWEPIERTGKILQDTGRLRASIKKTSKKHEAQVATNVIYAATHNFGDDKRNIKKREFMYLSDKSIEDIIKYLEGRSDK